MPEKTLSEQLLPWAPYIGTLGGALVGGFFVFATNLINKISEERKAFRQLMLTTALEHFKQSCALAIEETKAGKSPIEKGKSWGQVFNLDILKEIADYLGIHYTTVSKVIKEKIYKK